MTIKFSPEVNQVIGFSKEEAIRLHCAAVSPLHLCLAILRHGEGRAYEILSQSIRNLSELKQQMEQSARQDASTDDVSINDMALDIKSSRILRLCVLEAKLMKSDCIETEHLLLAILKENNNDASQLLNAQLVSYDHTAQLCRPQQDTHDGYGYTEDDEDDEYDDDDMTPTAPKQPAAQNSAQTTLRKKSMGATPVLDNFGMDLTRAAADGLLDPVVGREKEIERVAQILSRRKKNNPILIGQPGVGKSAIVEGLAMRIVQHRIPRMLWDKRIIVLDMASVVAGTKYRGQFEERIRSIVNELRKNPDIVVFIDEIHTIVGAGSAPGTMDAANMLKPALARGEFQCIGATTTDEYRKSIEKDGALERRFQKILVEPTNAEETLQILHNLRERYENHHQIRYTDEALEACVRYTERYITDRCFPDKAIDALDEAGSRAHILNAPLSPDIEEKEQEIVQLTEKKNEAVKSQNFELAADYRDQIQQAERDLQLLEQEWEQSQNEERPTVDHTHVAEVVSMMTGIPVQKVGEAENARLRQLAPTLRQAVVGQDEAVSTLVRAIQRSRVGLKDPNKPIGTFLFVGPTGVGKTYLTKRLAEEMFGSSDALIRIDMSEYMEKHTVSRMVGAPPGYVGYEEGGQLTEKVRRKPYSIVLLDEIEKAHQDVFNILLQVMDEGRLTDGNGATIDFKNTILIMTSNCGTRQLKEFGRGMGFGASGDITQNRDMAHSLLQKSLQKQFAPEFLNRLDEVIYFDQLDQQAIQQIVDIELQPLSRRIADMGYTLRVDDAAKKILAKKGYDVQYGARPLKRAIQNLLENPICEMLMNQQPPTGATLLAQAQEEGISLSTAE